VLSLYGGAHGNSKHIVYSTIVIADNRTARAEIPNMGLKYCGFRRIIRCGL
jgi:hypothetical protein